MCREIDKKLPVFCHKIKTSLYMEKVRHSSLQMNVIDTHRQFVGRILNIKRDIHVQKIKVKKWEFNFYCFEYEHDYCMVFITI